MSIRLYALLADSAIAEDVVTRLLAAGLADDDLHAVARHDPDHPLPEAGLFETTDLAPATGRGAAAGAATGVLAGLTALAVPPLGLVVGGAAVAASTLAGAGFGAWVAAMIGVSKDSPIVADFQAAIADGQVLLLIDCPADRQSTIRDRIAEAAPNAAIGQAEGTTN